MSMIEWRQCRSFVLFIIINVAYVMVNFRLLKRSLDALFQLNNTSLRKYCSEVARRTSYIKSVEQPPLLIVFFLGRYSASQFFSEFLV